MIGACAKRVSQFNRERKYRIYVDAFRPLPATCILDVGFTEGELRSSDNFLERNYPHPERIVALGLDWPGQFRQRYPGVQVVQYDGGRFPFQDGAFELGWSNAVLEHVGDRGRQLTFLRELRRVCRRGMFTTPNRYFPIEVHTLMPLLHFLPKRNFDACLRALGKEWATGDYMHLLGWRELHELVRAAGFGNYRVVRNRLGLWTLDFMVIFGEKGAEDHGTMGP